MAKKKKMDPDVEERINRKTSEIFIEELRRKAPQKIVDKFNGLVDQQAQGIAGFTAAEVMAHKVMSLAIAPEKANRWAIEMILDRTEGKPVSAEKKTDEGRHIERRLDEVTAAHLNEITEGVVSTRIGGKSAQPEKEGEPDKVEVVEGELPDSGAKNVGDNPLFSGGGG